jgi:8-oxo-dGTP pyrophosphatase MutT (NUDIX family)
MVQSNFASRQYLAKDFVESCGAILFDFPSSEETKVCLLHHLRENEWLLAKGRRNCGESRISAAIREVTEETGYRCGILPITMTTRAPSASEPTDVKDEPRTYSDIMEPFTLTIREIDGGSRVKLIWWYIAVLDEGARSEELTGEAAFRAEFFPCEVAIQKLTFESDRAVLAEAIRLVKV